MVYDPEFEQRRRRRLRNLDAPVYDDTMLGGPRIDVEEDPFGGDPNLRREAYADMGAFLKADLERARSRGEQFVERRSNSSNTLDTRSESTPRVPRPALVTPTTAKYARNTVKIEEDYDEYENTYESEDGAYEDYDEDDVEGEYEDVWDEPPRRQAPPRQGQYRPREGVPRDRGAYPRSEKGHSPNSYQRPGRHDVYQGYPDRHTQEQPRRRGASPKQPPRSPAAPRRNEIQRSSAASNRSAVVPTQPALLASDGTIPRNPCGDFLVTHIGGMRVSIECQEERRETRDPYHPNMPHIARINDPRSNATAFFVWNHED